MKSTNPKTLRAQMRKYLDLAASEPLHILRRLGQSYILLNEKEFSSLREELFSLQRCLLALKGVPQYSGSTASSGKTVTNR